MNLTDTTDVVFWDVPAPCSHSCPFLDVDLHAPEGGGLMRRQVGQCPQGPQQTNNKGQSWGCMESNVRVRVWCWMQYGRRSIAGWYWWWWCDMVISTIT